MRKNQDSHMLKLYIGTRNKSISSLNCGFRFHWDRECDCAVNSLIVLEMMLLIWLNILITKILGPKLKNEATWIWFKSESEKSFSVNLVGLFLIISHVPRERYEGHFILISKPFPQCLHKIIRMTMIIRINGSHLPS